jgi:hypothetical protein
LCGFPLAIAQSYAATGQVPSLHPVVKKGMNYNIAELNQFKNRSTKYLIIITPYKFNELIHKKNKEINRNILQYLNEFNYIYF